jgi:hypothetical protein
LICIKSQESDLQLLQYHQMGPFDAFWQLLGLFIPALATGIIAASLAKGLWRAELKLISWRRLAAWPSAAGSLVLLGGLVVTGHDGRMLTYVLMVAASALALWWAGFSPARR